jgi:hypothetical protein
MRSLIVPIEATKVAVGSFSSNIVSTAAAAVLTARALLADGPGIVVALDVVVEDLSLTPSLVV